MAIKKQAKNNYLQNTVVEELPTTVEEVNSRAVVAEKPVVQETEPKKKKSLDNWGRPRKLLIEGEKEKSVTGQLPEVLLRELRKTGKKEKKSMKEIIGEALLEKYGKLIKK